MRTHASSYVYILTNKYHSTLYVGVTNNLERRLYEHRAGTGSGFTAKYRCHKLVWYGETLDVQAAIAKEKQIKSWPRMKKIELIVRENPNWDDLL